MYLRIVNDGICPVGGFTILGVSTARDNDSAIGEFGSGNKHAINVCLRAGINPIIYCGGTRLEFFTQPETMGTKSFNRVYLKESNRNPVPLSIAVEYGEKDWNSLNMALREFVSNAIDAAGGDASKVTVDIVDKVSARKGKTIIGLPLTPEIQQWYNAIMLYFLHFRPDASECLGRQILPKARPNPCAVYRKGVLVRSFSESKSLYDYNFGSELPIDECRNLSDTSVREHIAVAIAKSSDRLEPVFSALAKGETYFETDGLPEWELRYHATRNAESWRAAWANVCGDAITSMPGSLLSAMAREQGYIVIEIQSNAWYSALCAAGVKSVFDVLANVNRQGDILREPTTAEQATLDRVWQWVELVGLTNGKPKPELKLYERTMSTGSQVKGYYLSGVIHIHNEDHLNCQTYLEEIAHHITCAGDYSRDLQDYAFRLSVKLAELMGG